MEGAGASPTGGSGGPDPRTFENWVVRPPRFENEVAKIRCFFRFLGYFGVGWPPCRRFDPPLKNPWRRPWEGGIMGRKTCRIETCQPLCKKEPPALMTRWCKGVEWKFTYISKYCYISCSEVFRLGWPSSTILYRNTLTVENVCVSRCAPKIGVFPFIFYIIQYFLAS